MRSAALFQKRTTPWLSSEQHAVGDVRQHAFGDRALVLREARAPECGREGIRHDHHGREDDEADEQDPVANLGRGCVDRPVGSRTARRVPGAISDATARYARHRNPVFGVTIPSRARPGRRARPTLRRCGPSAPRQQSRLSAMSPAASARRPRAALSSTTSTATLPTGFVPTTTSTDRCAVARRFLRAGMPGKELRVGMSRVEPRERGPVVRAQRVLHRPRACEPQRLDLTLLDDAAVFADRCTQRAGQSRVGAGALVIGRVAPESPGGRDQRQDEQD